MKFRLFSFLSYLILLMILPLISAAQNTFVRDFNSLMQIDNIIAMESSPSHLYVLSETEGLAVFRANSDTLQWLYTSTGMQQRGDILQTDARFAYLYGNTRRLTIIEPTSVLGVYSSTTLPEQPHSVQRMNNLIYIAMGNGGLGRLSLDSPESVDQEPEIIFESVIGNNTVMDIESDHTSTLYTLLNRDQLEIFRLPGSEDELEHYQSISLQRPTDNIYLSNDELIGSDNNGNIFLIHSDGNTTTITSVGEPVDKAEIWNNFLVVRTSSGTLQIGSVDDFTEVWSDPSQENSFFTITNNRIWTSVNNQVSPVVLVGTDVSSRPSNTETTPGMLQIEPISNVTIPFPRPLILPVTLTNNIPANQVEFSYRSNIHNASIRGNSFYWQPTATQIGRHEITIVARSTSGMADSTQFSIDVRPFNTPPRFTPVRPITINVNEGFTLDINAVDPDGMNPNLIRYLGVDLPMGANLNESTGLFTWTPTMRQVDQFQFQVIATDQYGAATQQDVSIRVIETDRDSEAEIE